MKEIAIKNKKLNQMIVDCLEKIPETNKSYRVFASLFEVADIITTVRTVNDTDLFGFVYGTLVFYPLSTKYEKYTSNVKQMITPVLNVIIDYFKNDYLPNMVEKRLNSLSFLTDTELVNDIKSDEILKYIAGKNMSFSTKEIDNMIVMYQQIKRLSYK